MHSTVRVWKTNVGSFEKGAQKMEIELKCCEKSIEQQSILLLVLFTTFPKETLSATWRTMHNLAPNWDSLQRPDNTRIGGRIPTQIAP